MRIALDVQHIHKWERVDHGAAWGERVEVWESLKYARVAKSQLEELGYEVYMTDWTLGVLVGSYPDRHTWANEHNIDLYFACHVNASDPPGNYGLVEIAHNSRQSTLATAAHVAGLFEEVLGIPGKIRRLEPGDRGWVCIDGTHLRASAILFEPFFINNPDHSFRPEQIAEIIKRAALYHDGRVA